MYSIQCTLCNLLEVTKSQAKGLAKFVCPNKVLLNQGV